MGDSAVADPVREIRPAAALTLEFVPSTAATFALATSRALERRLAPNDLSTSADWTETWLEHFGDLLPHRFVIARQDGEACGICLLVSAEFRWGPFRIQSLHVGTAGEPEADSVCVEDNRLLVDRAIRAEFCRALGEKLSRESGWDQIDLDGFAEDDAQELLHPLPGAAVRTRTARYFDLARSREEGGEIITALGRSTRANLRRRLRVYGELKTEWAESLDEAVEILDDLVRLHQARWTAAGRPGVFSSRRFREFQYALVARLLPQQCVALFRRRGSGETIGCLLLLVDRNRLLDYVSGFAPFERFPSPGLLTHYLCMQEALRRGYDAYDFLAGDRRHKRNLSTNERPLVWATWRRPRWKYRVGDWLRKLKRCAAEHPSAR